MLKILKKLTWQVLIVNFLFTFVLVSLSFAGNVYYVSPSGSNSNPGTKEKPWATPGYGSRKLKPGDTLIIQSGKYVLQKYEDDIIKPSSGRENAWIVIKGDEKARPVLAGRDNLLTAINLSGVSYVRIENLEITHDSSAKGGSVFFRDGIEILNKPASHIVLKDLYIHHIDEFGMNIQDVDDLQIINCRIEYCGFGALGGPAGMHGGWKNVKIQSCRLSYSGHYYQGGDGSNRPYDRPDGFGIEPSAGPVLIENTIAEHNYGDGIDSKAENTVIRKCVVANNSCDGVKLWGTGSIIENTLIYGRGDGKSEVTPWAAIVIDQVEKPNSTFEIINVTVDDTLGGNYLMYVQYGVNVPVRLLIRNSIFSGRGPNSQIYIGNSVKLEADHNLFYLPKSEIVLEHGGRNYTQKNIGKLGEGNIYGNPLFILPAWGSNGDYHLKEGSPAIDRGTSDKAPLIDLDGKQRPQGKGFDMGAYER
ncbi:MULTISPECIES: right-handed parallel beta-helix repeat-containing protein [Thermodesulfovibrio]|jgi:hypothetical protein|uniref:right-handed parallel beta-helix repeat-containing protein n=1 Tax=Thermodesulfovibrio TaxID=28261 RepID=UPI00261C3281|nr:right-handed parallel beta-helix repeat-containing protein [Thermodesulfovibrio sp.]